MAPSFTLGVIVYGILVLGFVGGLWLYYDRRDRAFYDRTRRKIVFHCIRCDRLYDEPTGVATAACPNCGHTNTPLRF